MRIANTLKRKNDALPIILLCFIAIVTHYVWFTPGSIITGGDWGRYSTDAMKSLWHSWSTWTSYESLGGVNIQMPFLLFMSAWSLLAIFGFTYDAATQVTFFAPIAILMFITPYYLAKHISVTKKEYIAFTAAIFYGTTTYAIVNQPPFQVVYALAPLVLLLFMKLMKEPSLFRIICFSLLFFVCVSYEVRISYILAIVLGAYYIYHLLNTQKFRLKSLAAIAGISVLTNIFWLLGTLKSSASEQISQVANRGLFGDNLFDLPHAITISNWFWNGGTPNDTFVLQQVPFALWFVPIVIIFGLIFFRLKKNAYIVFFGLISVIGILLTKQSTEPLESLYRWLYLNFPGFNLFREASKFFLLTALGYLGLLVISLESIKSKFEWRYALVLPCSLILIVGFVNLLPAFTGELKGLFVSRKPLNYEAVNAIIQKDAQYSRVYWLPIASRWGYSSLQHPKLNAVGFYEDVSKSFGGYDKNSLMASGMLSQLSKPYSNELYSTFGVKYVVIPARDPSNEDDFYKFYGDDREAYSKEVSKIEWLKPISNKFGTAVYLNNSAKPYFFSTSNVFGTNTMKNIDDTYKFKSQILQDKSLNYVVSKDLKNQHVKTELEDIFAHVQQKDLSKDGVSAKLNPVAGKTNTLYSDNNRANLQYQVNGNNLSLRKVSHGQLSLPGKDALTEDNSVIDNIEVNNAYKYYFSQDKNLNQIDLQSERERYIGDAYKPTSFSYEEDKNLIKNNSFEESAGPVKVDDCNPYDGSPEIKGLHTKTRSKVGNNSLLLKSKKHTACTSLNAINIDGVQKFSISYNYFLDNSQRAGYDVVFNDPEKTVISSDQANKAKSWYQMREEFTAPSGASSFYIRLKGYSDDRRVNMANTYYDEVQVKQLKVIKELPAELPRYTKTNLKENAQVDARISKSKLDTSNLISNPDFTDGLWQDRVFDCNEYDKNGKLSMSLAQDKVKGRVLQLGATRHTACTGPNLIQVKEGSTYLLSFDYKSPNAKEAGYYLGFNDDKGSSVSERMEIKNTGWNRYSKLVHVPYGATNVNLSVYAYSSENGADEQLNLYDNFSFNRVPEYEGRYFKVSSVNETLVTPKDIKFDNINSTKKSLNINGAKTPFYLNMSESYHSGWRLALNDRNIKGVFSSWSPFAKARAVSEDDHYKLNDFLNSWYVDPAKLCETGSTACKKNTDGSYDMELVAEFTPQRYFYLGLIISGTTLFACLAYLGWYAWHRRSSLRSKTSEKVTLGSPAATIHPRTRVYRSRRKSMDDVTPRRREK